jgi:hypothetical protein
MIKFKPVLWTLLFFLIRYLSVSQIFVFLFISFALFKFVFWAFIFANLICLSVSMIVCRIILSPNYSSCPKVGSGYLRRTNEHFASSILVILINTIFSVEVLLLSLFLHKLLPLGVC